MSDARDLIDKTDALLSRYRGNSRFGLESDFPVLTEVYPQREVSESPSGIAVSGNTGISEGPTGALPESPDFRVDLLVAEILRQLAPHIDEVLGEPLKERLEEHLRNALPALTEQVRIDIKNLVRVAVSQAVIGAGSKKD